MTTSRASWWRFTACAGCALTMVFLWCGTAVSSERQTSSQGERLRISKGISKRPTHSKLESILYELWTVAVEEGQDAAAVFCRQHDIHQVNGTIHVIVERDPSVTHEFLLRQLATLQIPIDASYQMLVRVRVAPEHLNQLAALSAVRYVRLPLRPVPVVVNVTSEGVQLTGAASYHANGTGGSGVKVAVIDVGFENLTEAKAAGELPQNVQTKDFVGTGIETTTPHGTAVAEIVYDMAPAATLWLLRIADEVDLGNAKDFAVSQGVHIISMSLLFPGDGFVENAGVTDGIANDAKAKGLLWANAVGNGAAGDHWRGAGRFVEAVPVVHDKAGCQAVPTLFQEFAPGDVTNEFSADAGEWVKLVLTWDDWPTSNQDYDLLLCDSYPIGCSTTCVYSVNEQTGSEPPFEALSLQIPSSGIWHVLIDNFDASGQTMFELYKFGGRTLEYPVADHSIMPPADATGVIGAGAIDQANWTTGPQEIYSSQGPTNDGRIKPDLMGPDGTSGFTYTRFYGTSASAPHVAGGLALLKEANPTLTPDQLTNLLFANAVDMGASGVDNVYGRGRLQLPPPPVVLGVSVSPNTWSLGTMNPGATLQMNEGNAIAVTNTGNGAETMTLRVKDPGAGWLPGLSAGAETYLLRGLFVGKPDQPTASHFQGEDTILFGEPSEATATQFAASGMTDNGVGVPKNTSVDLWCSFTAPTQTTRTNQQKIVVEVGAVQSTSP